LARELESRGLGGFELVYVLGSGLGAFAERLERPRRVDCTQLEHLPRSTVAGHAGTLVQGELGGVRVLVQNGRVHLYEGRSALEVTLAVQAFALMGASAILLTNAAGGLRPDWKPGTLMRIEDHLNFQGRSPLQRAAAGAAEVWDAELGRALDMAACDASVTLELGVYCALPGPSYETPAEIRMLRIAGADAVGMSTVLEAVAAHAAGMRVCGVSLVSNLASGLSPHAPSHAEVLEAGRAAAERFSALLAASAQRVQAALRA
jgi:purine-nucleoside phosphorylase